MDLPREDLKKLMDDLPEHPFGLIAGRRRSGKSHLCSWLLFHLQDKYKQGEVHFFSSTAMMQKGLPDYFHADFVHKSVDWGMVQEIVDKQEMMITMETRMEKAGAHPESCYMHKRSGPVLFVFDDLVFDNALRVMPVMNRLATTGRWLKIGVVILSQNACASGSINIQSRGNLDFMMCTNMVSDADYQRLADMYFGLDGKKKGLNTIKLATSERFDFIAGFPCRDHFTCLQEYACKVRAPPDMPEEFKIGEGQEVEPEDKPTPSALKSIRARVKERIAKRRRYSGKNAAAARHAFYV